SALIHFRAETRPLRFELLFVHRAQFVDDRLNALPVILRQHTKDSLKSFTQPGQAGQAKDSIFECVKVHLRVALSTASCVVAGSLRASFCSRSIKRRWLKPRTVSARLPRADTLSMPSATIKNC